MNPIEFEKKITSCNSRPQEKPSVGLKEYMEYTPN
jgi:hypothetical protein